MTAANGSRSILPLRLDGLVYEAGGRRLIDGISATLEAGPRTVILGPNGAGKSLLLRLCHGLLAPTAGHVWWNGSGVATPRVRQRQAMVFQDPVLLRRSARANVKYALALAGVPRRERGERADEALAQLGLTALAHQPARVLSRGERQRLAMARAWALHPEVLFLDEPTASLDPASTRAVEDAIGAFDVGGTKIMMTTHDMTQARRIADQVLALRDGKLVELTPADEFFARRPRP